MVTANKGLHVKSKTSVSENTPEVAKEDVCARGLHSTTMYSRKAPYSDYGQYGCYEE